MRVIHIITLLDDSNSYGGPVSVALSHAKELKRRGHQVTIAGGWVGSGEPPSTIEGIEAKLFAMTRVVPGLRFAGLCSPGLLRWLRRAATSFDVAHVHLSRDMSQLLATRVLLLRGVPVVAQTHGMIVPDGRLLVRIVDSLLTRRVLRACAKVFVLTQHEGQAVEAAVDGLCTTVLRNGVESSTVTRPLSTTEPVNVLFLARLHPRKGVLRFAEAARQAANLANRQATFAVVGPDEGELAGLLAYRRENSLAGILEYEGAMAHSDAVKRIADADIYVLPSTNEPYPVTVLEALAAGTPTICTDDAGFSEILAREHAALVCRPETEPLTRALVSLIDSPEHRSILSREGRRVVAAEFSIEAVVDELTAVYEAARAKAPTGANHPAQERLK